jgi:hypothetical protein
LRGVGDLLGDGGQRDPTVLVTVLHRACVPCRGRLHHRLRDVLAERWRKMIFGRCTMGACGKVHFFGRSIFGRGKVHVFGRCKWFV